MTPFALWRSRLPSQIGTWFSRDLTRSAMALVESGRVGLRSVDDIKIEATVKNASPLAVSVEWGAGTGPQALRPVCGCGASGICEHVVAALESVRLAGDGSSTNAVTEAEAEDDYDWLPAPAAESTQSRARAIWPVIASDGRSLTASLYLDTPRLRGVVREAAAILGMMEGTPPDDWDDVDRDLLRDETVAEAFGTRGSPRALARALFGLARHPRLRFDDAPGSNRHPSEFLPLIVDLRGLRLRATHQAAGFIPTIENLDGERFSPASGVVLDGPPTWLFDRRVAYLLDGSFNARRIVEAARRTSEAANGVPSTRPSVRAIARVAPYLGSVERDELGVRDAVDPRLVTVLAWRDGALVARVAFTDRPSGARAPFAAGGAIEAVTDGFVRFPPDFARDAVRRFVGAGFVPRGTDTFALHGPDRAAAFVREVAPTWSDDEIRIDESLSALLDGTSSLEMSISARPAPARDGERSDWFELDVGVFVDGGEALTSKELTALLASSGRFAEVRGKLVDVTALRERQMLLSEITERRQSGFAALLALRDELHASFGNVALPPEVEELRDRLREFSGIAEVEPPEALRDVLRGYQRKGLDFLVYLSTFSFGGILADDMGTGKTIQVISYLLWRKAHDGPAPTLVIAPTSVTHTWENEIARFAPELKTLRLQSGNDRAARFEDIPQTDVVITSYALARLDAQQLSEYRFRTLVLDEAQHAKNPSSQIARVVRTLRADHRLALTGTPVENSLRDLWAIFAFLEPGLLGTEASFRRRFELPIADGDERVAKTLRARLEPFVLRRTKEDVVKELPERTEALIECDLSPIQRRLYRAIAEAARKDVLSQIGADGMEGASVHVLAALTRLRQVCAHPGLLVPAHLDEPEASSKFDAFLETVDEILSGGHRVLVFSAFSSMLKIMRKTLDRRDIGYGYLDGSVKDRDRQAEVERFMKPDGPPLFLCSLKAGGVGLTLTAADYVILYDPWWNPAAERQAIDRTHRIGQHRPVTAYRLVTRGTVEEKIRALADRKSALSRAVVRADSTIAKSLTREDLEQLFADPE